MTVDHIDRNPFNNCRDNLRLATLSQQTQNRGKFRTYNGETTSSHFKGVHWRKDRNKWQSYITIDGKQYHLGHYDEEETAAKVYDAAARLLHSCPCLNFPEFQFPITPPIVLKAYYNHYNLNQ